MIDSWSCSNVASTTQIKKVELQISFHPSPYCIQCLNQGRGLKVNSSWLVTFLIGKSYFDEFWCDIIPMDVYDMLLGRP